MDFLMPTSMNSVMLRGPKPFCLCKWAKYRPQLPKPIQCNYFTAHGNIAVKCLDYQSREWMLKAVITRMAQRHVHVSRLEFNPRRPFESFLRRNVNAGKASMKKNQLKIKRFISRLEEEPAIMSTEKFARQAAFQRHMIMYHEHAEADENQPEVSSLHQSSTIPETSIQYLKNGGDPTFRRNDDHFDKAPCSSEDAYANRSRSYNQAPHLAFYESCRKVIPYQSPIDLNQTHTYEHKNRSKASQMRQRSATLKKRLRDFQSSFDQSYDLSGTQLTNLPFSRKEAYRNHSSSNFLEDSMVSKPFKHASRRSVNETRQEVAICRIDATGPIVRSVKALPRNEDTIRSINFVKATQLFDMGDDSVIDEILNNSTHAKYVDIRTRDGLMRSFYTVFLHHQALIDPEIDSQMQQNTNARRKFAYSALVTANINNPPINGIEFREYDDDGFDALDPYAKECLRNWSKLLDPVLLPPDGNDESGFEDSSPLRNWNWCVRQAKRTGHRNHRPDTSSSAFVEHPEDEVANHSHEKKQTAYAELSGDVVMEEVTERVIERRIRRIKTAKSNKNCGNVIIEPVEEVLEESPHKRSKTSSKSLPNQNLSMPTLKTPPSKRLNPFVTPILKRRSRLSTVRKESAIDDSFKSSTPKLKRTPKSVPLKPTQRKTSPLPLRRTPRLLRAICYKE